ncbi:hypothetical protein ASG89_14330 [Paenibacillus sp. Soil766]|uniref:type II toxin-antitoxin system PemK/MazF family toxin n=1 Tax=Paenibacillus sp. Soil766 TaxID=1736404 RepID=UPI00070A2BAC|nr:type II toxin-antitoxin system PemK/MazF family toxin [Paenibacillus sp. Soil766]KRE82431.1 hypothetical protein ASG89_14330 [Paenibacillus sp. Soil766]
MSKSNWHEIKRGHVFEAAMLYSPSDTNRPLYFFEEDGPNSTTGSIVQRVGDFAPKKIGRTYAAKQQRMVIGIKPRRVVIISNDKINKHHDYDYIMVAPMFTFHPGDEKKPGYQKILDDDHPYFVYFPREIEPGKILKRYIDVSQLISIHKGILLEQKEVVPADRMELLEDLLIDNLDLAAEGEDGERVVVAAT